MHYSPTDIFRMDPPRGADWAVRTNKAIYDRLKQLNALEFTIVSVHSSGVLSIRSVATNQVITTVDMRACPSGNLSSLQKIFVTEDFKIGGCVTNTSKSIKPPAPRNPGLVPLTLAQKAERYEFLIKEVAELKESISEKEDEINYLKRSIQEAVK